MLTPLSVLGPSKPKFTLYRHLHMTESKLHIICAGVQARAI